MFGILMLHYFKKSKKYNWNTKKDWCSVWEGSCDWLNLPKVVANFPAGDFSDDASQSGRPVEAENNQRH